MSKQKRALIVDDSKSARLVLRRMLEKHELIVDAVESAQHALDFLTSNRPNVIFMDHMMPGMDGFEAIKAIKNNPDTATIPVMMYTSKGGDLYVGQARALGAVGVLPKTVASIELFESLRKLGLVEERRKKSRGKHKQTNDEKDCTASERAEDIARQQLTPPPQPQATAFIEQTIQAPEIQAPVNNEADHESNQRLRSLLEEQRVEIRKDVLLSMENVARHAAVKLNKDVGEKLDRLESPEGQIPVSPQSNLPVILMALLLLLSLGWNYSIYKTQSASANDANHMADAGAAASESAQTAIAELQSAQADTQDMLHSSWVTAAWAMNQAFNYNYDEIALDGGRATTIETLLAKLREAGFEGSVTLQTHAGEFCLLGNQEEGFHLPAPDMSVEKCDFIGNPVQAADTPAAHQSLSFANFLTSTPLLTDNVINLEVITLPRDEHLAAYPDKASATAQSWNDAAIKNNRILIQLTPR